METALRLWQKAAAEGHIYAHIELAKYFEHTRRDPVAALEWTLSAMKHIENADLPRYMRLHWLNELEHRQSRLKTKAGKSG
jgi:TPR repeat protein